MGDKQKPMTDEETQQAILNKTLPIGQDKREMTREDLRHLIGICYLMGRNASLHDTKKKLQDMLDPE